MRRALAMFAMLWLFVEAVVGVARAESSESARGGVVLVIPVTGVVDLGLAPFVERVLETAAETRARLVVMEVNTFGGRVDAAVVIRDALLRSRRPTVAFVNKRAISAGALISLAAEKIVMARGATIGAATPVQLGQPGEAAKPVEEKSVSYVRKEFRATADARKRPGLIAEAMVDADVEIPGVIEKGKLLTLTTEEALRHEVADFEADSVEELLSELGLEGVEVRHVSANWAEQVVRFLTHPVVASLLMTLAMLGILIEIRTPGFGIPGAIGLLSFAAFFWGHWLVALVGWEQVLLVGIGVVLLAVEVFLLPGFGVAGVLGVLALIAGLSSSLFGAGASLEAIVGAVARVAVSSALALVAALLAMRFLPHLPGGRRLVLTEALPSGGRLELGRVLASGTTGTALSPLRPAGIALIQGERVDVVSEGEFVAPGQEIEVVRDEGTRVVVRPKPPPPTKGSS